MSAYEGNTSREELQALAAAFLADIDAGRPAFEQYRYHDGFRPGRWLEAPCHVIDVLSAVFGADSAEVERCRALIPEYERLEKAQWQGLLAISPSNGETESAYTARTVAAGF